MLVNSILEKWRSKFAQVNSGDDFWGRLKAMEMFFDLQSEITRLGRTEPMDHELKCWPEYFELVRANLKTSEVRKADRDFRCGDTLTLCEWSPTLQRYTGAKEVRLVTHVLKNFVGLADGYVCLSIEPITEKNIIYVTEEKPMNKPNDDAFMERMKLQTAEFAAMNHLAEQYRRIKMVDVVDDDYPEVRHGYESALRDFINALKGNGRLSGQSGSALSLKAFSIVNAQRCEKWHKGNSSNWRLSDWATALAGEVGEACNVIKKLNRIRDGLLGNKQSDSSASLYAQLGAELADSFIYLDALATAAAIDLADEVRKKFNATSEQYGFEERI